MIKYIHPVAGGLAILTIATFWFSTAFSELRYQDYLQLKKEFEGGD